MDKKYVDNKDLRKFLESILIEIVGMCWVPITTLDQVERIIRILDKKGPMKFQKIIWSLEDNGYKLCKSARWTIRDRLKKLIIGECVVHNLDDRQYESLIKVISSTTSQLKFYIHKKKEIHKESLDELEKIRKVNPRRRDFDFSNLMVFWLSEIEDIYGCIRKRVTMKYEKSIDITLSHLRNLIDFYQYHRDDENFLSIENSKFRAWYDSQMHLWAQLQGINSEDDGD